MRLFLKNAVTAALLAVALLACFAALYGLAAQSDAASQSKEASQQMQAPPQKTVTKQIRTVETVLPYTERRAVGAGLALGEETVRSPGEEGKMLQTVLITCEDGMEVSRTVLTEHTVKVPKERVILYGEDRTATVLTHPADPIAADGILTTPEGETYRYSRILSCTATAYSCEGYTGTTAIGTTARVGAVAVDPNYIPYGTELYIVSDDGAYLYGYATAEDCGNFRGYHVDLYFDTVDECWTFGRRTCTVYVLCD